ncbi:sensor histidine kinase [Paenibacillus sp. GD4]|uniref:cache domain-containing sensor histidine kinase n=1 Tax=Paenibacillus sp. GD4 TaxID=3068890 RepID=UPI002796D2B1|nr:sensor histidine kinase [Paenibacillus sp. GD4]MDQ1912156.1 sensor histidine kinase [Paenibacillus sp. GD4]
MFYSLRNRLIAFFVVLLVFSFGTMSYFLFNESRSIIRSYIESSALEKMDEYGSYIDMALLQMYDASSLVFNSTETKNWDSALSDPDLPAGEKMLANISMSKFLTTATNNYSGISSISLYRREGVRVSQDNGVVTDASIINESWYRNFVNRGEQWVSSHWDQVETAQLRPYQVVSLLLPIGTFEPLQSRNVIKVNMSTDFFLEPLNRIHLGESGTIFLLDQNGSQILPQEGYSDHTEAVRQVEKLRNDRTEQGVVYVKNEKGDTEILVYKKLKRNRWTLVSIVPETDLYAKLYKLRTTIIVFSCLLLICVVMVSTWLSYGISRPLSRLTTAMKYVQKGDFEKAESHIPAAGTIRSEVEYVTATFRNMVARLRDHIKTEFELKLLRQQAEYKALLMQINPHFLFNTLELLSSLALQRRTEDTVKVIESLGKMLRFSLHITSDLVPLQEEIKYVRHYAAILQIRFGDRLAVSIEEDGGATDTREIVKFILQPLIENAVKYSFRKESVAQVRITVYTGKDLVRLAVEDNGPGITPEAIEQLTAESSALQLDQVLSSGSRHIGLRNVLARCRLYYGRGFTYAIRSEQGNGTRIELHLPIQEGKHDVPGTDRG